jgi:hypothetical protein
VYFNAVGVAQIMTDEVKASWEPLV